LAGTMNGKAEDTVAGVVEGEAKGVATGTAEGEVGCGIGARRRMEPGTEGARDRRRRRRRCASRDAAAREMGDARKRVAADQRPDPTDGGERLTHESGRQQRSGLTRLAQGSMHWHDQMAEESSRRAVEDGAGGRRHQVKGGHMSGLDVRE
jgi:hypothetical protein